MSLALSSRDRCYVIGEAGTCHAARDPSNRYLAALDLVRAAANAGADAVKFQLFTPSIRDDMFCWIEGDERRAPRWLDSAMSLEEWDDIKWRAEDLGIDFLASVFQYRTVGWLKELGVKATKVASRAADNFPYADATGTILVSNGMNFLQSLPDSVVKIECEANYPSTARWKGKHPGFSDHSGTPERAIDAISRGCRLVEVHFYTDPERAGPDLPASLDLEGLKRVCEARDINERKAA